MNRSFAEYTTSTAFSLQLSKNQCNALLRVQELEEGSKDRPSDSHLSIHLLTVGTLRPLLARGLVFWRTDANGQPNGFGGLTEAGRLVVGLLKEAGMTVESTNTVSMLARIDRDAA